MPSKYDGSNSAPDFSSISDVFLIVFCAFLLLLSTWCLILTTRANINVYSVRILLRVSFICIITITTLTIIDAVTEEAYIASYLQNCLGSAASACMILMQLEILKRFADFFPFLNEKRVFVLQVAMYGILYLGQYLIQSLPFPCWSMQAMLANQMP
jgi:hypothetical protein